MTAVNVRYAAFLEKKTPTLPCPAGRARGTDTQIVILTLSLYFSFNFFSSLAFFWQAGRPLCERAGHAGAGVPFVLYFGDRGSLLP